MKFLNVSFLLLATSTLALVAADSPSAAADQEHRALGRRNRNRRWGNNDSDSSEDGGETNQSVGDGGDDSDDEEGKRRWHWRGGDDNDPEKDGARAASKAWFEAETEAKRGGRSKWKQEWGKVRDARKEAKKQCKKFRTAEKELTKKRRKNRKPEKKSKGGQSIVGGKCVADHVCATIRGDPHLVTFDGLKYDCQGHGEFVLAKSTSSAFEIQGRFQTTSRQDKSVSVTKAISIDTGVEGAPQFDVFIEEVEGVCILNYYVNGVLTDFSTEVPGIEFQEDVDTGSEMADFVYFTDSGIMYTVLAKMGSWGCVMNSKVCLPPEMVNNEEFVGLLGNPNGNPADDWMSSYGFPESASDTSLSTSYKYCTTEHCVHNADESIFAYETGTGWADFYGCGDSYDNSAELAIKNASPECKQCCVSLTGIEYQACLLECEEGTVEDCAAEIEIEDVLEDVESKCADVIVDNPAPESEDEPEDRNFNTNPKEKTPESESESGDESESESESGDSESESGDESESESGDSESESGDSESGDSESESGDESESADKPETGDRNFKKTPKDKKKPNPEFDFSCAADEIIPNPIPDWLPSGPRCCTGFFEGGTKYAQCDTSSCPNNFGMKNLLCHNFGTPQFGSVKNGDKPAGSANCPYIESDQAICDTSFYTDKNGINCRNNPNSNNGKNHCLGKVKCKTTGVKFPPQKNLASYGTDEEGYTVGYDPNDPDYFGECNPVAEAMGMGAGTDCFYMGNSDNFKVCGDNGADDGEEPESMSESESEDESESESVEEPEPQPEPEPEPEPEPQDRNFVKPPPSKGSGSGDPHFKTWTGDKYDYHGECDLVLVHNPDFNNGQGLRVHIRTTRQKHFSYIEKIAIMIGDEILEFDNDVENFLINGEQAEANQVHHKTMFAGFIVRRDKKAISIRIQDEGTREAREAGAVAKIDLHTRKNGFPAVIVDGGKTDVFRGSLGLLGDWETGSFTGRDGKTLIEVDPINAEAFALEWQVRDDEPMLFKEIRFPQYPQVCVPPEKLLTTRLGLEAARKEAEAACAHWKEDMEDCIFDVIATRDVTVAHEGHIIHVE